MIPTVARLVSALAGLIFLIQTGQPPLLAAESDPPLYQPVESPDTLNYLLHLPAGYEQSDRHYPLLFFLHGIAQKGGGSTEALERVARDGPFRAMREGRWDPDLPLIVVGPQSSGIQPWWRGDAVRAVLAHVNETYRVDPARRYVAGISMGGRAAWWLAKNFPDEIAALVPVSGWAGDVDGACDTFRGMAIWAFHGARDPLVGVSAGRRPIEDLSACSPSLTPSPHITVIENAGHGRWRWVFETEHGDSNRGADGERYSSIYQWMLTFSREAAEG